MNAIEPAPAVAALSNHRRIGADDIEMREQRRALRPESRKTAKALRRQRLGRRSPTPFK